MYQNSEFRILEPFNHFSPSTRRYGALTEETQVITRRQLMHVGAMGAVAGMLPALSKAQGKATQFRFKLGTDLPVTHSVNVRLKEAIAADVARCRELLAGEKDNVEWQ